MLIYSLSQGLIEITKAIARFVDTPEFQRLRRVHMGLWYHVYPAANETRFMHCIEVCHLAGLACARLGLGQEATYLVRVAALLHDIGHVATSHTLDHVISNITGEDHEARGCRLIKARFVPQLLSSAEADVVCALITGRPRERHLSKFPPFMFGIVHSLNPDVPDVDRLAYLASNGLYTGLSTIQPSYLIHHIQATKDGSSLEYNAKASHVVAHVAQTRAYMHRACYKRRYLEDLKSVLLQGVAKCIDLKSMFLPVDKNFEWLKLTDGWLDYKLREHCPGLMRIVDTHQCKKGAPEEEKINL